MTLTEFFIAELEREAPRTRRTLEQAPEGRHDWKPHEKSMPLGYLAALVADLPGWTIFTITQDELDIRPPGAEPYKMPEWTRAQDLVELHDRHVAKALDVLRQTDDAHLMKPWRLVVGGQVMSEDPRHIVLRDTVMNHLVHHRAQLGVYLRLNGKPVPALYGPSADERPF